MQGLRLERLLPFAVLALSLCWSSSLGGLKFIPIYDALTVKAQKNSPPHVAFEEMLESERQVVEWATIEKSPSMILAVEKISPPLFARKVQLREMLIQKVPETFIAKENYETKRAEDSESWVNLLPPSQAKRLREAQIKSNVMEQDWSMPTWSDMAREVLEKSGVLENKSKPTRNAVYVAGVDSSGKAVTEIPQIRTKSVAEGKAEEQAAGESLAPGFVDEPSKMRVVSGPIEITGGLAVTNEHHIEVRRNDEGVLKELGSVDLREGLYNIEVENLTGTIIAHLVDKEGRILGAGSFRMSKVSSTKDSRLKGPRIKIEPEPGFSGIASNVYNPGPEDRAPSKTIATFVKGAKEVAVDRDGSLAMDNVTRTSSTVVRVAAPAYMQTAAIVVAGQDFKTPLYPNSMIQALQEILQQQRQISFDGDPTVIWGRVSLDGKDLSGVEVQVESDPSLIPIYFNQFLLPDPKLQRTGENGLFAFVDVSPGFHSLVATKAEKILGYQNVIVEEGSIAQGDIESSHKKEAVPLRVYDAFTGEPVSATVVMQSLEEEVSVSSGTSTVILPQIKRLGLMRLKPEGADYVSARYVYNDTDDFVHAPVVHWSWISAIKNFLRIDDQPSAGVIVGFVPDENFEVHLAAYEDFNQRQIVYFDMQGRILQEGKGVAGGGFILYNVPEDIHEVVVLGERTQKIYSKVLPVDPSTLSVLSFRE